MKITIIVEGRTETAFKRHLVKYLKNKLEGRMPKLDFHKYDGRIPTKDKLRRVVSRLLSSGKNPSDHVIALTDVYTGQGPYCFNDASDAKKKMREWVGPEDKFSPHAAQYDFEAWLLPYWPDIQRLAGHNGAAPGGNPETINHLKPPSYHIKEIFRIGRCREDYSKPRDAGRILEDNDLTAAINQCSELKSFINTIISICGGTPVP